MTRSSPGPAVVRYRTPPPAVPHRAAIALSVEHWKYTCCPARQAASWKRLECTGVAVVHPDDTTTAARASTTAVGPRCSVRKALICLLHAQVVSILPRSVVGLREAQPVLVHDGPGKPLVRLDEADEGAQVVLLRNADRLDERLDRVVAGLCVPSPHDLELPPGGGFERGSGDKLVGTDQFAVLRRVLAVPASVAR